MSIDNILSIVFSQAPSASQAPESRIQAAVGIMASS